MIISIFRIFRTEEFENFYIEVNQSRFELEVYIVDKYYNLIRNSIQKFETLYFIL